MTKGLLKKTGVAAALALALGTAATSAYAALGIKFDPTGGGGAGVAVDTFTWQHNTALAVDSFTDATGAFTNPGASLNGQGLLFSYDFGVTPTANSNFTYVFSVPVQASQAAGGTNASGTTVDWFDVADYGATNYFKMYYTPGGLTLAQRAAGDFASGTLILEGKVTVDSAGTKATGSDSTLNVGGEAGSATTQGGKTITTLKTSGNLVLNIDVCQASEIKGGSATTTACKDQLAVSTQDTNFFRQAISTLSLDIDFNQNIITPFDVQVTVPQKVNGVTPDFGDATAGGTFQNNFTCETLDDTRICDAYFGARRGSLGVHATLLPEPGSLALLGLSLGLLGWRARRKG